MTVAKTALTAPVRRLLERVFAAEICGLLPYQCRESATVQAALEDGLINRVEAKMGSGPLRATVRGFELTHRGRILYCENCAAMSDEEIEAAGRGGK